MPKPKYCFRSVDNEAEAVMASLLTAKHFKGKIKTVAGINNDYSYGRDNWAAFLAIMKKLGLGVTPVAELWPKLGETNFTSHVAALQQAKPDLIFCSFWSGDAPILLKQAHAAGLTQSTKFVMTTAGGVHESAQEGVRAGGHDPRLQLHVLRGARRQSPAPRVHQVASGEVPGVAELRVRPRLLHGDGLQGGRGEGGQGRQVAAPRTRSSRPWPASRSSRSRGKRGYRADHIMECSFFQGMSTHKNRHDFVTIDPVEVMSTKQIQKPSGMGLYDWINSWKA